MKKEIEIERICPNCSLLTSDNPCWQCGYYIKDWGKELDETA